MKFLSLFSGIGGMDLGLERAGMTCIAQVESDPYCRAVLAKHWPGVWRHDDVRTFCRRTGDNLPEDEEGYVECAIHKCEFGEWPCVGTDQFTDDIGWPDMVCGGFPCTDASCAGKGAGLGGSQTGLWFEFARIVGELGPAWVLAENVPALKTRGYDRVCHDLEALGYSVRPFVVGAEHVGAPHKRHRVWIVANLPGVGRGAWAGNEIGASGENENRAESAGSGGVVHAAIAGLEGLRADAGQPQERESGRAGESVMRWPSRPGEPQHEWEAPRIVESGVGQPDHGLSRRLDGFARRNALRALGNACVPQIVEVIGRAIMSANRGEQ